MSSRNVPLNPYSSPATETALVAEVVVSDEGRTVEYEIEIDDLVTWNTWVHRHAASLRSNFSRSWTVLGVALFGLIGLLFILRPDAAPSNLGIASVALVVWALYPMYYRWKLRRLARAMYSEGVAHLLGRRRISLTQDYVVYSSPLSQTITRWAGIEQVVVEQDVTYVLISKISAIIVPQRAFANDEQFRFFARTAQELHAGRLKQPAQSINAG